ncbi:coenzyme F420-0:L-glutamate ligase [Nocardioides gilvus]|uniref:coenzyme F420-0:L-glutamate ligase n=1 Tax=Nocardioides gilvus TaxID=1735589 RepID=UPI000D748A66|nr:coenzyme F420-0:L-glutamate ligase [Nocardioides gilvus]
MAEISVVAPDGIGEITAGTDLAAEISGALALLDGDVVVVTSKVVSKAEGRVVVADDEAYEAAFAAETVRVVARRGLTRIVRNRLGLVMAAAGIDRSNVTLGAIVLLPHDPDASARALRKRLHELTGHNVGVVVTDTAGRAWREGQTDIAIGVAGLLPYESYEGREDAYGNPLAVTLPAVADEIAGAAELAQSKLGGRPVARLRGRSDLVLPPGQDGPGAVRLQRPEGTDLFGFGAREAVVVALAQETALLSVFGAPASESELLEALGRVLPRAHPRPRESPNSTRLTLELPAESSEPCAAVLRALCASHGWVLETVGEDELDQSVHLAHLSPTHP